MFWMQGIERARDQTHVQNLTHGQIADLLVAAGLEDVTLVEEPFELDFDEWFDRGTPTCPKAEVRALVLAGKARGFSPALRPDGGITIRSLRTLARGVKRDPGERVG